MSNNRPHIKNLKSKSLLNGEARPPMPEDLEFGEIAINYASDKETIYIKNDSNEIVEFKSSSQSERELEEIRETISDNELVISSSLNDLNKRIINEKAERVNTDAEIIQNLGNEITNRTSADNTLRNDLGSQISQLSLQIPIPDGKTIITDDNGNLKVNYKNGLTYDNGLNVAVGNSLTTESGDIEVKPDNKTIIVDTNGVYVNVNDEGGIGYNEDGLYVKTGDGLTVDTDSVKVNTPSNSGLTVDSNGIYLRTSSTDEIGGLKVHGVYDSLSGYTYREVVSYFEEDNPEHIITVEEYEAITDPDKESRWGENTQDRDITVAEYEELSDKNKARCTEIRTPIVFDGENGNYGVKLDGDTDKAYVNVPVASSGTYGTIKVWDAPDIVPVNRLCPVVKDEHGLAKIMVNTNYFYVSSGIELSFSDVVSSLLKSLGSFYEVIIGIEVMSFNTSTGEIIVDTSDTVSVRKFTVYYNPNNLTNSQIIAGAINGSVNVKIIMTFSAVASSFIHKFPKIWESFFVLTDDANDELSIFNPYCKSIDSTKNEPYVKIEQLGVSQDNKFTWRKIELVNYSDWVNNA